ncbi:MAG: tetratricopeptide repeat protein [Candidatus Alcyoniella australis]|nr:tetratricopeptide repeat protein [Candidatus Alcyoniella australis]
MHRCRTVCLLLLVALFAALPSIALCAQTDGDAAQNYNTGNAYFDQGEFELAALAYKKALTQGGPRASAEYNLANALLHSGRIGPAVLHYRRALELAPRSADIANNLAAARERIPFAIKPLQPPALERFVTGFVRYTRPVEVFAVAATLWLLLNLALLIVLIGAPGNALRRIGATLCAALVVALLALSPLVIAQAYNEHTLVQMVVLDDPVKAREAPDSGKILFTLREGQTVKIAEYSGSWVRVETKNHFVGWIPAKAGETI